LGSFFVVFVLGRFDDRRRTEKAFNKIKTKKQKQKSFKLFKKIDAFKIAGIFSVQKKI
jgi:hypothetical protein